MRRVTAVEDTYPGRLLSARRVSELPGFWKRSVSAAASLPTRRTTPSKFYYLGHTKGRYIDETCSPLTAQGVDP
ncbi:hypothetical protein FRACA_2040009 [Frankia canadensis]|uniref:Uncharacterized protein n=1 Tax=Frankia canadensis TaxID=1836972 RepID=A0A2I2KQB8_9ACTN|nr:hypothetical protein FRACA_2040009 [Frankia canadensis]SOU55152.1 hypothetical protein FRACA_2040009 [Frankia canadensis]